MAYYVYEGSKTVGPFEAAELVKRPGFGPSTLVYPVGATGADAWKPASTFPDLAAAPPPPPPPAAPAPVKDTRTEITLIMPAPRKAEPVAEPAAAPAPVAAEPPKTEPAKPAGAKPGDLTVLVVDDDDAVRSFVEMSVQVAGFQVITATDGQDALKKVAAKTPDLIVTDLMMPGVGGYEFLRSLQHEAGRRIPVFVVTGSQLEDSTVGLIKQEANVVEFIPKPIRVPAFVAALHKHLKTAA